jgi:transcriptional regulator with XRE-family HTH domain
MIRATQGERQWLLMRPLAFGALLRGWRLAAGLTQEALAEQAALSARGIGDLERGVRRFPRLGD